MFEVFDPAAGYIVSERCQLPHWFQPGAATFITFRTEDSIPKDVAQRWYAERHAWLMRVGITQQDPDWRTQFSALSVDQRREFHETFSSQFLDYLDRGCGRCVLKKPELARHVANALEHFDGHRYDLGDFVIMPNHVHLIVAFHCCTDLETQCYSWKKFSAGKINRDLGRKGRFWQEESFDHVIRSPEQFDAITRYITDNPKDLPRGEYLLSTK